MNTHFSVHNLIYIEYINYAFRDYTFSCSLISEQLRSAFELLLGFFSVLSVDSICLLFRFSSLMFELLLLPATLFLPSRWESFFSFPIFVGVVLVWLGFRGMEDFLLGGALLAPPPPLFAVSWVLLKQLATMNGVGLHLYSSDAPTSLQGNSSVSTWSK